ncbi:hypothetical protein J3R82DRAFT_3194 [Butyriboletus roseoflavus]|nr:hypothetical protein J3R82DRAFT_3194 [Butyriboletus roseoflavus]
MEFTSKATPCFAPDDRLDDTLSLWNPWSPSPSHPTSLDLDSSLSRTEPVPEFAVPPYTFRRDGYGHTMPTDYTSGQGTRESASVLLDTRIWSPFPGLGAPYAPSGSHVALVDTSSYAPLPRLADGFTFSFGGKLEPDLGSGLVNYHQEHPDYPTFPKDGVLASSSSSYSTSGSTEDHAGFLSDESQPPTVLHCPTERKGSGCGRDQRACALNIEGLWIDKADLHPVAGQGGDMINVHECQWAKSTNPCGMWIIGSRARIGAHVRKWHARTYVASAGTQCLWEGCTADVMLKDSINRHVVTVHLGERFSCWGCNQKFSRKDVYDQHVQKGEACRDAGAAVVYGTACRMIDTHMALQQGGAVRYADTA